MSKSAFLIICMALPQALFGGEVAFDNFYHEIAEDFRAACLKKQYSDTEFIKHFNARGFSVENVASTRAPFHLVARNKSGIMATMYRNPSKCCVTTMGVSRNGFVGWLMHYLPLKNPRQGILGPSEYLMFKPLSGDAILAISWDVDTQRNVEAISVCKSAYEESQSLYQAAKPLTEEAP